MPRRCVALRCVALRCVALRAPSYSNPFLLSLCCCGGTTCRRCVHHLTATLSCSRCAVLGVQRVGKPRHTCRLVWTSCKHGLGWAGVDHIRTCTLMHRISTVPQCHRRLGLLLSTTIVATCSRPHPTTPHTPPSHPTPHTFPATRRSLATPHPPHTTSRPTTRCCGRDRALCRQHSGYHPSRKRA